MEVKTSASVVQHRQARRKTTLTRHVTIFLELYLQKEMEKDRDRDREEKSEIEESFQSSVLPPPHPIPYK